MATSEKANENALHISWCDNAWVPVLNRGNVLKYFSERSNSFYDSACNNEMIKMQGLSADHLVNMTGLEYTLLHCQEPILYIIRKQTRHSPTQVTSIADYYVIAGTVYQAPEVKSVVNSRLTSTLNHIESAFSEALSYSRYHPSKGYWWQFNADSKLEKKRKKKERKGEEIGSLFQCGRVDQLLQNLRLKFPHKYYQARTGGQPMPVQASASAAEETITEGVDQISAEILAKAAGPQQAISKTSGGTAVSSQLTDQTNLQNRVKSEFVDGTRPPVEKRTKYI